MIPITDNLIGKRVILTTYPNCGGLAYEAKILELSSSRKYVKIGELVSCNTHYSAPKETYWLSIEFGEIRIEEVLS